MTDEDFDGVDDPNPGDPLPSHFVVVDPDNPAWEILPVLQGKTEHLKKIWALCQKHGANIIGGYARYMASPNAQPVEANDIDIFMAETHEGDPRSMGDRFNALAVDLEALFDFKKDGPMSIYFFDEKPHDGENFYDTEETLSTNLVTPREDTNMRTFGTIYQIMEMFDFPVARAALKSLDEVSVDPDFYDDEKDKLLRWKHINCPLAAIYRLVKYSKKGYFARPREVVNILVDWQNRDDQYKTALVTNVKRDNLSEEDLNNLEKLLWVD